ncbi:MAG: AAA family ATPase [Pseudonocardia sp.]
MNSSKPARAGAPDVVPGRVLVLVAGMPGAGKSTLLARLVVDGDVAVVDSESQRAALARAFPAGLPYARYRPLVHLLHRLSIARVAIAGPPVVAVHLPATGAFLRGAVAVLAALTGRAAHLVWLDVEPAVALRGQAGRGRVVPSACFAAHARRAARAGAALRAGHLPWGYARVTLLDRSRAAVDPGALARLLRPAPASGQTVPLTPGK